MKKSILAAAVTLSVFAAQAQGLYLGAGMGLIQFSDTSAATRNELISVAGGTVQASMDTSGQNLRLVGGYAFNEYAAFEVGYIRTTDFKTSVSGTDRTSTAYTASIDKSFSGLDFSAVFRPSLASGYNNFFVSAGVHRYTISDSNTLTRAGVTTSGNDDKSGTGIVFGGGYDVKLDKTLGLRLSVKRVLKIGGDSENKATDYSAVVIKRF